MTIQQATASDYGGPLLTNPPKDLGGKLAQYLSRTKTQQKELAAHLGVEASYVSRMVNNHINWVNGQYFGQIASKLRLTEAEIKELNPAAVIEFTSVSSRPSDSVRSSHRVQIPVLALAAAGSGTWTEADVLTYIEVEPEIASRPNRVTFQVDGDSMEPTFSDGDFIHVDFGDNNPQDDKIYVVHILTNGIVVKRVREYADGTLNLVSDNLRYAPINPDEAKIIGRVFAVTPRTRRV